MNDYISRDAIMRQFADHVRRSNNSDFAPTPTWNHAVQIVEYYPAADVVSRDCYDRLLAENDELRKERPVVHGRWEHVGSAEVMGVFACSVCGWQTVDNGRYCSYCGAKMDEVSE